MNTNKIKEIEGEIADLKARLPKHSAPPAMWQTVMELEDELDTEKRRASKANS